MADELRLKVSAAEYTDRITMLDNKMDELEGILEEYEQLQRDSVRVLGEGDSNLDAMQESVRQNIKAVNGQWKLLGESREMLQKQNESLEELSGNVQNMFQNTMQTAKTAFNMVKIVGDLVN